MHIIKVAVPILFALIVLILLWTLFKAARKKIKDTQLTMAAMVAAWPMVSFAAVVLKYRFAALSTPYRLWFPNWAIFR